MRVGLLVGGTVVDRWKYKAVETLVSKTDAETTLIIEDGRSEGVGDYLEQIRQNRLWSLHLASQLVRQQMNWQPRYREPIPLDNLFTDDRPEIVECKPVSREGFGIELPESVIEKVAETTDIVIRFGFGIIVGDILSAPEYGVLSYHHGNVRKYRGRPPGFWEFMNGENSAGVTVQQLTESLDGGLIAAEKSVDIRDCNTWQEVKQRQFSASDDMLVEATENVKSGDVTKPQELGKLYTSPNTTEFIFYLWKNWVK